MAAEKAFVARRPLPEFALWDKMKRRKAPVGFDIELTARCNLACRHCYINLPAGDKSAKANELTAVEIERIAGEAVSLGAVWCLLTGGEPLLRKDFFDVYTALRKKGLLISVYTNATLVSARHIRLFKEHPPRNVEITVYGATKETYERVTRVPGSFAAFQKGLGLFLKGGVAVRLKAMALRSNMHELPQIADFCRARTTDYFRFDPVIHYRFDRDPERNRDIESERLTPDEVVALEKADSERFHALETCSDQLITPESDVSGCRHLFRCGAGKKTFVVGHDGKFKLCASLLHPDCLYDLRRGPLTEAWRRFVPRVLEKKSSRPEYLERCAKCAIVNLCLWCPAHAYLETGALDAPVDKFCQIAHARGAALKKS